MHRPHFYKLMLRSTIQERKLRIPDDFIRKYGNYFSTSVRLAAPGGHVWGIGLIKTDNKVWLHENWHEFVERYSIRVGYFLVFRYEGNSLFNVHIFNLPASEINYQSKTLSGRRSLLFEEMEDDDYVESLGSSPPDLDNKSYNTPVLQKFFNESKLNYVNWYGEGNPHIPKGTSFAQVANLPPRDVGIHSATFEHKHSADEGKIHSPGGEFQKPKKRGRKRKIDPNQLSSHEDESEMRASFYESASARKRTITSEERERAVNAAKAFEPVNPFCRVVLRPSYLYRGCIMYFPSCFAKQYLSGVSGFIKLQFTGGKQWPVRCRDRGGRAMLSQGWYEFTLENNLGEGDVCVFELLKSRDVVLKVTVFRVHENMRP
ncbi:hypothetical protein K2173_001173 [Erythroxylum novogranatense]|uniref:TF-B3 domain-containing protein n=1 Tax=Erythroxylum novogranatense TaxID=1862640 RepID=A0AAV8TL29_9ROSI|nr:hypothetical protein K2173_001173 [Erythroxylum novogranatense]